MPEFKISDGLSGEVLALQSAVSSLDSVSNNIPYDNQSTLETCMAYKEQNRQIIGLLRQYTALVLKDAADINMMISEAKERDNLISEALGGSR